MAIYIASDLHGDLNKFKFLLKKIQFDCKTDHMYILGDVLDRGDQGIELLNLVKEFVEKNTMTLIKGNHELFAQMYIEKRLSRRKWKSWGGAATADKIDKMTECEKEELHAFLKLLPYYCEISWVNGKATVLTHSGFHADYLVETEESIDIVASINKAVEKDEFGYLVSDDLFYVPQNIIRKLDKYLVVGHVPTIFTREDKSYEVIEKEKYMCLDSGAGFPEMSGKMCAYRVDDGQAVYV